MDPPPPLAALVEAEQDGNQDAFVDGDRSGAGDTPADKTSKPAEPGKRQPKTFERVDTGAQASVRVGDMKTACRLVFRHSDVRQRRCIGGDVAPTDVEVVAVRHADGHLSFNAEEGESLGDGAVLIVAGEQHRVCEMAVEAREARMAA